MSHRNSGAEVARTARIPCEDTNTSATRSCASSSTYRWCLDRCGPVAPRACASPGRRQCSGTGSCIAIAPWSCRAEPPCPCRGSCGPHPVCRNARARVIRGGRTGQWCCVECQRPVPRSISLFVDHRLRDGDNVVNRYSAITVNCSQKLPRGPKTVRYVRALSAETCGKSIFPDIMSARFLAACASARSAKRICRCALQKDIDGHQANRPHRSPSKAVACNGHAWIPMCARNMKKSHAFSAEKRVNRDCVFVCIH